uniref:SANT domain-containing protein n=1 Tax=Meloidogyne hapla TaxID=6305 RepID=A0A1I8AZX8_MELHA
MLPSNNQQQQHLNGEQSSSSNLYKNYSKSPNAYDLKIARKKRQNNKKHGENNKVGSIKQDSNKAQIPLTNTLNSPKRAAIRVGSNFQVLSLPEPDEGQNSYNSTPMDLCLWKMHKMIKDDQLSNYCIDAYTNFGIEPDRLPHKTLGSLVEHYYKTKKKQNFKGDYRSYGDIEANCSFSSSDDDTDSNSDTMVAPRKVSKEVIEEICEVCKEVTNKVYSVTGLKVCKTCNLYFRATGQHRVFPQPAEEPKRQIPKCPTDMRQICDEFVEMARYVNVKDSMEEITVLDDNDDKNGEEQLFVVKKGKTVCEAKISEMVTNQQLLQASTKRLIQNIQKQKSFEGCQKYSFVEALEFLSKTQSSFNSQKQHKNVINHKWFQWEKQAVFHALIQFDADENIVAEIIPTKTPAMIKNFYLDCKEMIDEEIHNKIMEPDNYDFNSLNGQGCSNKNNFISGNVSNEPEVIELD